MGPSPVRIGGEPKVSKTGSRKTQYSRLKPTHTNTHISFSILGVTLTTVPYVTQMFLLQNNEAIFII